MLQGARVILASALSGAVPNDLPERAVETSLFAGRRGETQSVAQLMRQLLDLADPRSDAEALRLLRQSFPSASLADRVTAMAERARP